MPPCLKIQMVNLSRRCLSTWNKRWRVWLIRIPSIRFWEACIFKLFLDGCYKINSRKSSWIIHHIRLKVCRSWHRTSRRLKYWSWSGWVGYHHYCMSWRCFLGKWRQVKTHFRCLPTKFIVIFLQITMLQDSSLSNCKKVLATWL